MRLSFKRNLGKKDQVIRIAAGISAFFLAIYLPGKLSTPLSIILLVASIPLVVEGVAGY